jgi:hypothetical protein
VEILLWIVGGAGALATACGFAFWRYLKQIQEKAEQGAVLVEKNLNQGVTLDAVQKAKDARSRLRTDRDYARRVRSKYSRDGE